MVKRSEGLRSLACCWRARLACNFQTVATSRSNSHDCCWGFDSRQQTAKRYQITNSQSNQCCAKPQFIAQRIQARRGFTQNHAPEIFLQSAPHRQKVTSQPVRPCDTVRTSVLTWQDYKQVGTCFTWSTTQYVPSLLCYLTTKLALWRECEPDCVPELPQIALMCHSRGILNTLAKTCSIKYTGGDQYTCT